MKHLSTALVLVAVTALLSGLVASVQLDAGLHSVQPARARTVAAQGGAEQRAVSCSDLPISSQLITASSCWRTGTYSMVVAGASPTASGAGAVAVIAGQAQQVSSVAGAGSLSVVRSSVGFSCVEGRGGELYTVALASDSISLDRSGSCAADTVPGAEVAASAVPQAASQPSAGAEAQSGSGLPPPSSPSYYEYYGYLSDCGSGATSGCPIYVQGQQTYTASTGGLVILDFGSPCSATGQSGSLYYGVQMFDGPLNSSDPGASCVPDSSVVSLMDSWVSGYESDHGAGTPALALAAGTSNSYSFADLNSGYQPASLTQSGADWYSDVVAATSAQGAAPLSIWGASDLEQSGSDNWYDGSDSVTWVEGYSAAAQAAGAHSGCSLSEGGSLADFGDYNQSYVETPGEPFPWTNAQVYEVSSGIAGTCAEPEIYYSADATEWASLSASESPAIDFVGVMAEDVSGTLSPAQAWTAMEAASEQSPAIPSLTDIATSLQGQPPQVTSVSPDEGPVAGGTAVTIQGADLLGATAVYFGSTAAPSFKVVSATSVTATSPSGTAGLADVTVETPLGASSFTGGNGFLYSGAGTYHPLTPARIEDTRPGSGFPGAGDVVGPGQTLDVQVTGVGGVPATGVAAVTVNLTETQPTASGYLTLFPTGLAVPLVSNLDFQAGQTRANLAVVAVGLGGQISVYNSSGSTQVVIDVEGWYDASGASSGSGLFNPLPPQRIVDTRPSSGYQDAGEAVGPGQTLNVDVAGQGGVPAAGAEAVVFNLTETTPSSASYLSVYPTGQQQPTVSNLNFSAGQTTANQVVAEVGADGQVSIYNYSGTVQVIVDVAGWFSNGGSATTGDDFVGLAPTRLVDTRQGSGAGYAGDTLGPDGTLQTELVGSGDVPGSGVSALAMNVTVADSTSQGWLRVWESGNSEPTTSEVNWPQGSVAENMVMVGLGDGGVTFRNGSAGDVDVVVDVFGYYTQS